jgi:hypothetical protein
MPAKTESRKQKADKEAARGASPFLAIRLSMEVNGLPQPGQKE